MEINKWDVRFLELAGVVAAWSKDPSTKTGAVIVRQDRSILSLGFNGFPKNMRDDAALYADRETKYSRIVHCEMNALIQAKTSVEGCTLYTWPFGSCDRCVIHMLQAGISRFVFPALSENLKSRWEASVLKTKSYLIEAGVEWLEIPIKQEVKL
jgi:dCMP deaminase